jgi:hypothetical protein
LQRVYRVVDRIVRGLTYYHTGRKVPPNAVVTTCEVDSLRESADPRMFDVIELVKFARNAKRHELSRNVMDYRYRFADDGTLTSVWLIRFYAAVRFISAIDGYRTAA